MKKSKKIAKAVKLKQRYIGRKYRLGREKEENHRYHYNHIDYIQWCISDFYWYIHFSVDMVICPINKYIRTHVVVFFFFSHKFLSYHMSCVSVCVGILLDAHCFWYNTIRQTERILLFIVLFCVWMNYLNISLKYAILAPICNTRNYNLLCGVLFGFR